MSVNTENSNVIDIASYLGKVKLLLGIETTDSKKDAILKLLIEQVIEEAINYTHNSNVNQLSGCIIQMVCYKYNLLDSQGSIITENYSGVSFTYSTDYPAYIIQSLNSKRKVVFK